MYYRRALCILGFLLNVVVSRVCAQSGGTPTRTFPVNSQRPLAPAKGVGSRQVSDTVHFDISRELASQLLSFDEIYQIALQHSPAVRLENAVIDTKASIINYTKVAVLQNLSPFVNYSRGNQLLVGSGSSSFDFAQVSNGYRMGINLQLPMSDVVGRRYKLQQGRAELQGALAQRDLAKLALKRELNRVYQTLITAQRMLRIRLRDEQAALMMYRVAEVNMQQGKLDPADYARSSNQYSLAQITTEKERGEFMAAFRDLEILVGVRMIQLQVSH